SLIAAHVNSLPEESVFFPDSAFNIHPWREGAMKGGLLNLTILDDLSPERLAISPDSAAIFESSETITIPDWIRGHLYVHEDLALQGFQATFSPVLSGPGSSRIRFNIRNPFQSTRSLERGQNFAKVGFEKVFEPKEEAAVGPSSGNSDENVVKLQP
ncbi:MAG: hypothetical protein AAFO80_18220, partial [Pseudomonadota bacterium]